MSNWEKEYEAAQREQERNQELKRHNDLLDRHSIQQRLASEEKNRLLADQVRQTEKQNEILQQQAIAEERRREQELKQKQEQFYKDRIFELKKYLGRFYKINYGGSDLTVCLIVLYFYCNLFTFWSLLQF